MSSYKLERGALVLALVVVVVVVLHSDHHMAEAEAKAAKPATPQNCVVKGNNGTTNWAPGGSPYEYYCGATKNKGAKLKVNDTLQFIYSTIYNVVNVSKAAYDKCNGDNGQTYKVTGNTKVPLPKGMSYFISHLNYSACFNLPYC